MGSHSFDHTPYMVSPGETVDLTAYSTRAGDDFERKADARKAMERDIEALRHAQQLLWTDSSRAVLIILQAMDAAGKDGTIKHVMTGVNPQGVDVHSFKAPSREEQSHHFLWRPARYLPSRGRIAIFNRSYYEEVLIVRVHPSFLDAQRVAPGPRDETFWQRRFDAINMFEHALIRAGTSVIKIFLHVSKQEQRERFLERLTNPDKHWKFSKADLRERKLWPKYQSAYEQMLGATSTAEAPWYVVPADQKWFSRALVADIIKSRIESLDLEFPTVSEEDMEALEAARKELEAE